MTTLRQATLNDFEELVSMYKELIKIVYHNCKLSDDIFFYGAVIEWFRQKKDIIVAEVDGKVAGFTLAYVENLQIIEPYYFGDIAYVKPEFRNTRAAYLLYNNVVTYGYRDWETDRKSTRLNSSHSGESRMPSSA